MALQQRVLVSQRGDSLTNSPDRIPCATFSLHPGRGGFPCPAGTVSTACFFGGLKGIFSLRLMTSDSTPSGPCNKINSETEWEKPLFYRHAHTFLQAVTWLTENVFALPKVLRDVNNTQRAGMSLSCRWVTEASVQAARRDALHTFYLNPEVSELV